MDVKDRATFENVTFTFKYTRSRFAVLAMPLAMVGPWTFLTASDSYHGLAAAIDFVMQTVPLIFRITIILMVDFYFIHLLITFYLPCVLYKSIVLFDGRQFKGFGFWGEVAYLPIDAVEQVLYRNGAAILMGKRRRIRLPIQFIEMEPKQRQAVRTLFRDAVERRRV